MEKQTCDSDARAIYEEEVLGRLRAAGASEEVLARCRKMLLWGRETPGECPVAVSNRRICEWAGIEGLLKILAGGSPPVSVVFIPVSGLPSQN
jgi:hypothetical protein